MSHARLQRTSFIVTLALAAMTVGLWAHAAWTGDGAWIASLATVLAGQAVVTYTNVYCHGGTQLNSKSLTDQLTTQLVDDLRTELSDGLRGHIVAAVDAAMADYVRNLADAKRVEARLQTWGTKPIPEPVPLRALTRVANGNTA